MAGRREPAVGAAASAERAARAVPAEAVGRAAAAEPRPAADRLARAEKPLAAPLDQVARPVPADPRRPADIRGDRRGNRLRRRVGRWRVDGGRGQLGGQLRVRWQRNGWRHRIGWQQWNGSRQWNGCRQRHRRRPPVWNPDLQYQRSHSGRLLHRLSGRRGSRRRQRGHDLHLRRDGLGLPRHFRRHGGTRDLCWQRRLH